MNWFVPKVLLLKNWTSKTEHVGIGGHRPPVQRVTLVARREQTGRCARVGRKSHTGQFIAAAASNLGATRNADAVHVGGAHARRGTSGCCLTGDAGFLQEVHHSGTVIQLKGRHVVVLCSLVALGLSF